MEKIPSQQGDSNKMFTLDQTGLFADGSGGHHRIRVCLGNLLANMYRHHPRGGEGIHWKEVEPIVRSLDNEKPDDCNDEYEAIDWLNKMCEEGCHFELMDGDLMLIDETRDDYDY